MRATSRPAAQLGHPSWATGRARIACSLPPQAPGRALESRRVKSREDGLSSVRLPAGAAMLAGAVATLAVGLGLAAFRVAPLPHVLLNLGMAVVLGASGLAIRRRPRLQPGLEMGMAVVAAAYLTAYIVVDGGVQVDRVAWLLALPVMYLVVVGDRPRVIAVCGAACLVGVGAIVVLAGSPPAEAAMFSLESLCITALGMLASNRGRRAKLQQLEAKRRQVEAAAELADSERKRSDAERMASIGRLAAGVGHEINNPLTFVIQNLELAREELGASPARTPEMLPGALGQALEGARRIEAIVRELRRTARAGHEDLVAVDARDVAEGALRLVQNQIRQRARIRLELDEAVPVLAEPGRLSQVFINLLTNAVHAVPAGNPRRHEIGLRIAPSSAEEVRIEVWDTGDGISASDLEKVFEPFFTTKRASHGTGLGLAITKNIVESFGGRIGAQSSPGGGTHFHVTLARAGSISGEVPRQPAVEVLRPAVKAGRVLIIDDERPLLDAMTRALERDHEVTACSRAAPALARIEEGEHFDVILCDVMMPEMDGAAFFERLRTRFPKQAERVVFMTGGAFERRSRAFLDSVSNPRLDKPCDLATVRQVVADQIEAA